MMKDLKISIENRKLIMLFYKEYETDKFFKYDRLLKRMIRPLYDLTHRRRKITGFQRSFQLLCLALESEGWVVRVNDYPLAEKFPKYPVGLVGYPSLLDGWNLQNPALLGPSLYDHPGQRPGLMNDSRYKKYLVLAPWMYDMFVPVYGDCCVRWFAGIDLDGWPDTRGMQKEFDLLIYVKILWDKDKNENVLVLPICEKLKKIGLSYKILRYGHHDHARFRELLAKAKGMIFLCEHETQGIAYQEALASNVPVLAWDNGYWLDPLWKQHSNFPIPASSVPFFSPSCGRKFKNIDDFELSLIEFLSSLQEYEPRKFVELQLSMKESSQIYADAYFSLLSSD